MTYPNLRANPDSLTRMLDEIAAVSDTPAASGVTRIAFTEREREAHRLVAGWWGDLGLEVYTDPIGNTIAERPGRVDQPAIGTGSHLDSVPRGGRFDGIAGVVAAVETARLMVTHELGHDRPIRFVAFAGEEGARFGQACIGSKGVGGMWTPEALAATRDADGTSIADAMSSVGLHPDRVAQSVWTREHWAAFIELHVEQGQVLEDQGIDIGVVDLISGSTRFELLVEGVASHTGSTPMSLRADALAAAAEIVLMAEAIANDARHRGTRCTVGKLEVEPGSMTTIPGTARLWVDVRDVDSGRQRTTANEIVSRSRDVAERRGVHLEARLLSDASPVVLPIWIRDLISDVCKDKNLPYRVMYSGASHDTQMVNNVIPGGMLFVPSRKGLSHVPAEWTSSAQLARGVDVLLASLLALDARLSSIEGPQ